MIQGGIFVMYQTVRYEKLDNIAIVTVNRPEALNALNSTVIADLEMVIAEVENLNRRIIIL
jgi:enoyl-CoA hydratase